MVLNTYTVVIFLTLYHLVTAAIILKVQESPSESPSVTPHSSRPDSRKIHCMLFITMPILSSFPFPHAAAPVAAGAFGAVSAAAAAIVVIACILTFVFCPCCKCCMWYRSTCCCCCPERYIYCGPCDSLDISEDKNINPPLEMEQPADNPWLVNVCSNNCYVFATILHAAFSNHTQH